MLTFLGIAIKKTSAVTTQEMKLIFFPFLFLLLQNTTLAQRNKTLIKHTLETKQENEEESEEIIDEVVTELFFELFFKFFYYGFTENVSFGLSKLQDSVHYARKIESDWNMGSAGKDYQVTTWRTETQIAIYSFDYRRYSTLERNNNGRYTTFRTDDVQLLKINFFNSKKWIIQAGYGLTNVHNYNLTLSEFTAGLRYYIANKCYLEAEYRYAGELDDSITFRKEFNIAVKYRPIKTLKFLQLNLCDYTATYFDTEKFIGLHGGIDLNFDGLLWGPT